MPMRNALSFSINTYYVYISNQCRSAINGSSEASLCTVYANPFQMPPSIVKHRRASGRPLHCNCEVHLELLSKYQENQTVAMLKDSWSFLRKGILSASEFSGGNCKVFWWSTCTTLMRKSLFLALTNKNSKIYLLSNRLLTFQTLDLARHACILITVGLTTSWGMSISRSLNDWSKNRRESIST
jgi:hypothetical protein